MYFSPLVVQLVLRCGKGETHTKGISPRFSMWQTKLHGTPSSGELVQAKQTGFVFPSFILIGTLKPLCICQMAEGTQDNL